MQQPSMLALLGVVAVAMAAAVPNAHPDDNPYGHDITPGAGGNSAEAHASSEATASSLGGGSAQAFASSHAQAVAGGLSNFPCGNPIPGICDGDHSGSGGFNLPPVYCPPFPYPQPLPIPVPGPTPVDPTHGDDHIGNCNAGFANSCCNSDQDSQGLGNLPIFGGSCLLSSILGQGACTGVAKCCPTDQNGLLNVNLACGSVVGGLLGGIL